MTEQEFRRLAIQAVEDYHNKSNAPYAISKDDISIVWQCRALQNYKATLTIVPPNGMYYEATYNGDKNELYLDVYKKVDNIYLPSTRNKFEANDIVKLSSEMAARNSTGVLPSEVGIVVATSGTNTIVKWAHGIVGAYNCNDLVLAEDSDD